MVVNRHVCKKTCLHEAVCRPPILFAKTVDIHPCRHAGAEARGARRGPGPPLQYIYILGN